VSLVHDSQLIPDTDQLPGCIGFTIAAFSAVADAAREATIDVVKSATRHAPTITAFAANCAIAALRKRGIEALPLLRHAGL
jgi:hypothetical protein